MTTKERAESLLNNPLWKSVEPAREIIRTLLKDSEDDKRDINQAREVINGLISKNNDLVSLCESQRKQILDLTQKGLEMERELERLKRES